jgi:hypothetical protein
MTCSTGGLCGERPEDLAHAVLVVGAWPFGPCDGRMSACSLLLDSTDKGSNTQGESPMSCGTSP